MDSDRTTSRARLAIMVAIVAVAVTSAACEDVPRSADPRDSTGATRVIPTDSQSVVLSSVAPVRKYNVESGVIEYRNSQLGAMQRYYFADFGAREAVYLVAGSDDSVAAPFDVSIYADGWRYDYSTRDSAGIAKFQPNARGPLLGAVADLRSVQLTPLDKRTIAGRSATGVRYSARGDVSLWMWKGLPLRIEQRRNAGDTLIIEAQRIDADAAVGVAPFVVPKHIAITRLK